MIPPVIPLTLSLIALTISIYFGVLTHFYTKASLASLEEAHAHQVGDYTGADIWHEIATKYRATARRWDLRYRWENR